ncbi:MAG: methionyl-tRNA formyltransferase [Muribaculaceae bacterium]|nr:methionyl-tRNA formyltransferase [Muribaculaceae bacterium]
MNKEDLRIVFFGTPEFAVESLDRLVSENFNIVGVVTATDKPAGRGHKMLQSAVKQYAISHNLNILQPASLKDPEFVESLRELKADLFIVIAFRMLPEVVWTMPPLGTFNLHGSLLPRYRGAAPINWALINGDSETGVTTFFLKHEIDTGDIIDRRAITVGADENFGSVYERLMHLGADLTVETVKRIIEGSLKTMPQDSEGLEEPTPAPKIFKETCHIDWSAPAAAIHNLVRGLSPIPGAWTTLSFQGSDSIVVKIFATAVSETASDSKSGEISATDGRLLITCGDSTVIEVKELQPAGKKRMSAADYLRGAHLENARFE